MQTFRAEFHVHTLLSPCAEVEMIPPFIVQTALVAGINLIAITDHNASANVAAVQKAACQEFAASGQVLTVMPAMELQSKEEVHILCIFDSLDQLQALQAEVDRHLPGLQNDVGHFGDQFEVDETGKYVRRETRLLSTSVSIPFDRAVDLVKKIGGLAIPAHVDRKAFGLIENLGFVPPDSGIEALEVSRWLDPARARNKFPQLAGYPLLQGGDVHRLDEFLGSNHLRMEEPSITEIRLALQNSSGRSLSWHEQITDLRNDK